MNGTPRLRSAFPSTPRQSPSKKDVKPAPDGAPAPSKVSASAGRSRGLEEPLIPLNLLDAPSQRFYVAALYVALTAWRLFDYSQLVSNETDSPWLWMKWTMLDGVLLSSIPSLRIPWLEWSTSSVTVLFLLHAVVNGILMFRIPIPLEAWIMALTRMLYDRELAVSERRVKPGSLLDHASLISGRQIIHILPEGSAMLNPHHVPFCIDKSRPNAVLPLFMNQTNPVLIELLRIDLDTNENEIIEIPAKEARKMKKHADREFDKKDTSSPRILEYPVKKTGVYRLNKVVDESNLEVQRVRSDALVVPCPHGSVKSVPQDKCRGELSDFYFQVEATPPLRIKYRKTVNDEDSSDVQLTVHPESFESPLARRTAEALVKFDTASSNVEWARPQKVEIPVNETLGIGGSWNYFLEEIRDGCGNTVNYTRRDIASSQRSDGPLGQEFRVRERPKVVFHGCSPHSPLKVAKGNSDRLPLWINPTGSHNTDGQTHHISYSFMPQLDEGSEGASEALVKVEQATMNYRDKGPQVTEPGLYTIDSITTDHCSGEVFEPASCLISNPPEPDLSVDSDSIPHQCAGNSIGLHLDLDLIGTPPFQVSYTMQRRGERAVTKIERVNGMRTQLEFKPQDAGFYKYEFLDISDLVYGKPLSLKSKNLVFTQDVKPTAWARFQGDTNKRACIGDTVSFNLHLTGDEPWTLEYDIVHQGRRTKHSAKDITSTDFEFNTPPLNKGGQYVVSLASITDKSGCKISLNQEAEVDVRHQRPSVAFGQIEGKNSALTLQSKSVWIPVRMAGEKPWLVRFTRASKSDPSKKVLMERTIHAENDFVEADSEGIYQLESVSDRSCPGTVEPKSNQFEVDWIARPSIQVPEGQITEQRSGSRIRAPVCVGDQDAIEISFSGSPPYHLKYDVLKKPSKGPSSISTRTETIGLGAASIAMDTTHAGTYEYRITELGDQLYDHDRGAFSPLAIQQQVHPLPAADFVNAGKTYNYCKEEALKEETIPITLTGTPPFAVEVAIRHHSTTKPEIVTIPRISSTKYDFQIPQRALSLGSHVVSIRKVSDANKCQRLTEVDGPSARVNVVDVPSISPLELATDFCVGDRISYTLAGTPPFNVFYTFEGQERKASTSTNSFRRLAERPGNFTITAISDRASTDSCRARVDFTKTIHELPSVKISKGRTAEIDIHEGGDAEIVFEFGGTPPFEFTYTRSTNAARGKAPKILETKTEVSEEYAKAVRVSEEGTYEVVAIRDRYCSVSTQKKSGKGSGQRALTFG